jgi:hypothetical protein
VHRFRSLAIALVVLALSAGAVFASKTISDAQSASSAGLARAGAASGLTLPASGTSQLAPTKTHDETAGTDATSGTGDDEKDDSSGTDASSGTGKPTDNHGAVVSAAAHLSFEDLQKACGAVLDGKNKGAYVSAVARGLLDVTVVTDSSGGTTSITCALADGSSGTTAPTVQGGTPLVPTTPTTPPTKLHGRDNAAAKHAEHRPQGAGKPDH